MITEYMKMASRRDAGQWASDFRLSDEQEERLANWLWINKPFIGCTWNDHPISKLTVEDLWDIV